MPIATFDTLKFSKALREAGVSEKQADAEATVLAEVFSLNFREIATKEDLKHQSESIEGKIRESEQRLNMRSDAIEGKIRESELRLIARIDQMAQKQASDTAFQRWMIGLLYPLMAGIAVRLFFYMPR